MNLLTVTAFSLSDIFTQQISILRIIATLVLALIVGLAIFFVYKHTFAGVMYSKSLNVSFVMLCMVTAFMLMLINNNLTLSLGMVGALSIVRFRTAVKDPIDTVFMFWAIGEGIAIGVGYFLESFIAVIGISLIMFLISLFRLKSNTPYILVVHYTEDAEANIEAFRKKYDGTIKTKTKSNGRYEVVMELRVRSKELKMVNALADRPGIIDVSAMEHNGDIVA